MREQKKLESYATVGFLGSFDYVTVALMLDTLQCHETDVRVIDGRTANDGRVQICYNGLWGSVCDDSWDERDAKVVCRQLGYEGSEFRTYCTVVKEVKQLTKYVLKYFIIAHYYRPG